ncbi:MAG: class II aldolase/adducin family protein [Burkholderiaceae bacterium]
MTTNEAALAPRPPYISPEEAQARLELAAVYRLCAHEGWDELIYNHATIRVPGEDSFLVKPHGLRFTEVRASNLIKLSWGRYQADQSESQHVNAAAYAIHTAVLKSRPDINCTVHVHTPAGVAMSARKSKLLPLYQGAMQFYNRVSYHDFEGFASDEEESERITRDLGPRNKAMILRNHGLLTGGVNGAEALSLMRYLVQACEVQLRIDAAGADYQLPPDSVCERNAAQWELARLRNAPIEWAAQLRLLDAGDPSYRE